MRLKTRLTTVYAAVVIAALRLIVVPDGVCAMLAASMARNIMAPALASGPGAPPACRKLSSSTPFQYTTWSKGAATAAGGLGTTVSTAAMATLSRPVPILRPTRDIGASPRT